MSKLLVMAAIFSSISAAGTAHAAPLIIAQNVSSMCEIKGTTVLSVSVKLNATTFGFYGTGLWYHFDRIGSGPAVPPRPSPTPGNIMVKLNVPTGTYNLTISPDATLTPSSSRSPAYPVTVPANLVMSVGGVPKFCNVIRREGGGGRLNRQQ